MGVVDTYPELVEAFAYQRADVEDECRVSAFVIAGVLPVHIQVHILAGALEPGIYFHSLGTVVYAYGFRIPCGASPVTRRIVLAVNGIPGMGK